MLCISPHIFFLSCYMLLTNLLVLSPSCYTSHQNSLVLFPSCYASHQIHWCFSLHVILLTKCSGIFPFMFCFSPSFTVFPLSQFMLCFSPKLSSLDIVHFTNSVFQSGKEHTTHIESSQSQERLLVKFHNYKLKCLWFYSAHNCLKHVSNAECLHHLNKRPGELFGGNYQLIITSAFTFGEIYRNSFIGPLMTQPLVGLTGT